MRTGLSKTGNMKHLIYTILHAILGDENYYQLWYFIKHKKFAELKNPRTFNDKTIWLSLNDRKPEYKQYVDKYEVREYIKETIGEKYLNDLYGVYDSVDDIDWDKLPDSFVMKATHGSGWIIVCEDKASLNFAQAKKKMAGWLKLNFYTLYGEWVYRDLKPRIICERLLKNDDESGLTDYKFYCFNGKPRIIQVDRDRFSKHTRTYFDTSWNKINFELGGCPSSKSRIPQPGKLDEMLRLSEVFAKDKKYIRVDFYFVNNEIYFGELTFYNGNGMLNFDPPEYDNKLGDYIPL